MVSVLAHHVGVTLAQHAVDDQTNLIAAEEIIIGYLGLEGRLVTMDALLTRHYMVSIRELSIESFLGCFNRVHEVGKARQRLQGRVGVVLDDGTQGV